MTARVERPAGSDVTSKRERPDRAGRATRVLIVVALVAAASLLTRGGLGILVVPPYAVVGATLAVRRPSNPIGWTLLAASVAFAMVFLPAVASTAIAFADGSAPLVEQVLAVVSSAVAGTVLFLLLFVLTIIFPSGRWPIGRLGGLLRAVTIVAALTTAASVFAPLVQVQFDGLPGPVLVRNPIGIGPELPVWDVLNAGVLTGWMFILVLAGAVSLVVRFGRARGVERQQLRWVVAAIALLALAVALGFVVTAIDPGLGESGPAWIPALLSFPMVPIAIGTAVLRYRLYEIDRIVSRTISWGATTALVAALFASLIVALQGVLAPITGGSSLAVAGSTLAAAAIFQPARRRMQAAVDHRFNRGGYDAERILGRFAEELRGQTDLGRISVGVADAIARSLGPERVTVWMRRGRP